MERFKNVLYVSEPPHEDRSSLDRALALARNHRARLTAVAVVEPPPASGAYPPGMSATTLAKALIEEQTRQLEALVKSAAKELEVQSKVLVGTPFLEIVREVLRGAHDIVLKTLEGGARRRRRLFGSTDMHLLRKCPCPVWLTKSGQTRKYRRILAAVDFDTYQSRHIDDLLNREILEVAASIALSESSELIVVHAWEAPAESQLRYGRVSVSKSAADAYVAAERFAHRRSLHRLLDQFGKWASAETRARLSLRAQVVKGRAREVIPVLARKLRVDLLGMGTVARTGIPGLLMGNTAERILGEIQSAVIAVKPPGFVGETKEGELTDVHSLVVALYGEPWSRGRSKKEGRRILTKLAGKCVPTQYRRIAASGLSSGILSVASA